MKIIDCKQHTTEWEAARLGRLTASEMDALLTPQFKIKDGASVETYLYEKLSEKILGYKPQTGGTFAMEQGGVVEGMARSWYSFEHNVDVREVGFIIGDDERIGCSPDGLLPDGSGMEIKSPQGPRQLRYYIDGVLPAEYRVQVAHSLYVTGAPYWTFISYHRDLPPLVVRVERDPKQMQAVGEAIARFFDKYDPIYKRIKDYKDAENAAKLAAYYKAEGQEQPKGTK